MERFDIKSGRKRRRLSDERIQRRATSLGRTSRLIIRLSLWQIPLPIRLSLPSHGGHWRVFILPICLPSEDPVTTSPPTSADSPSHIPNPNQLSHSPGPQRCMKTPSPVLLQFRPNKHNIWASENPSSLFTPLLHRKELQTLDRGDARLMYLLASSLVRRGRFEEAQGRSVDSGEENDGSDEWGGRC